MKRKVFSVEMSEHHWQQFNRALDHMTMCHSKQNNCGEMTKDEALSVMRFRQKYETAILENNPKIITIPTLAD